MLTQFLKFNFRDIPESYVTDENQSGVVLITHLNVIYCFPRDFPPR